MAERKFGREFGMGTFLGDAGDVFLKQSIKDQILEIGWSHACPVIDEVVRDFTPEWTLARYSECNFVFGLIASRAEELNHDLHEQLTQPVKRLPGELPKEGLNPEFTPTNFKQEMSPLSTPWGYALPRVVIEQMGRGKNNENRTEIRILRALDIIDEAIEVSETPSQLLVNIAERVIMEKAGPKAVLSHMLSKNILLEEGCETMFEEIKKDMDRLAPFLRQTYNAFSIEEREVDDIINFSEISLKTV